MLKKIFLLSLLLLIVNKIFSDSIFSTELKNDGKKNSLDINFSTKRYILYDVNPPEGFNLRRDVYVRIAVFVKKLLEEQSKYHWILVLPPWGKLYHWKSKDIGPQVQIPWGYFFDISSLRKYIPIMEMHEFLKEYPSKEGGTDLDIVYILQNDEEMFKTGKFEEKNKIINCQKGRVQYEQIGENEFFGNFWGYDNITARQLKCVIFHGTASNLKENLQPQLYRSIVFDHMEIALHDYFGSREFWQARRSMRFNLELYKIANNFRKRELNSDDISDGIERPENWQDEKKGAKNAVGGPYLAVHLRRQDFLKGRVETIPTIKSVALQLMEKLKELNLKTLFVATDTDDYEFKKLEKYLENFKIIKFIPNERENNKFKDGGIAIIDQIICSHARYFIGTLESTFTFRIQEEREIIGFPVNSTFNRLCGKDKECQNVSQWKIVW
ncbi:GDP-fucose protein O-fucosyltransferase 2 [Leptopilina boulardi]|uniref:GDP-fucose protein O-fucosyltransferase 2 n=1 Tax=Leptopilina boulardi TaxID=63433 RepID=UPI0021F5B30A|nr:GDP-fucose protein O-fucosyltransferase 2 [Leptopilina boulardi]